VNTDIETVCDTGLVGGGDGADFGRGDAGMSPEQPSLDNFLSGAAGK